MPIWYFWAHFARGLGGHPHSVLHAQRHVYEFRSCKPGLQKATTRGTQLLTLGPKLEPKLELEPEAFFLLAYTPHRLLLQLLNS